MPTDPILTNPYAPATETEPDAGEAETFRRQYLAHESAIKTMGSVYMIGAMFLITGGLLVAIYGILQRNNDGFVTALFGMLYFAAGAAQLITAIGLNQLKKWGRAFAVALSFIGLIGAPVGTIVCGYFLYLLLGAKGKVVFSDEYKSVITQTPHIVPKTPIVVRVSLVILFVLVAAGLASLYFSAPQPLLP